MGQVRLERSEKAFYLEARWGEPGEGVSHKSVNSSQSLQQS